MDFKKSPTLEPFTLQAAQSIHCPNCGSHAERFYLSDRQIVRTQCPKCDYLMITCATSGKVIEAYAPGIYAQPF
ncbi:MAG: replication restart DNA helicase PriA [Scytolyngbya sp. HA4215-MV1]|nr:replication restart DNA helicase PriA [Scytolyngbya sp. HA4215-MV1]